MITSIEDIDKILELRRRIASRLRDMDPEASDFSIADAYGIITDVERELAEIERILDTYAE
jgi:hypothetical protein